MTPHDLSEPPQVEVAQLKDGKVRVEIKYNQNNDKETKQPSPVTEEDNVKVIAYLIIFSERLTKIDRC